MTRIDHAAEAWELIESAYSDDPAVLDGIRAVAHATLALVEQQRIANLIAWTTRDGQTPIAEVRNIIAEGLGL
jgi:hypothetical protein